MSGYSSDGPISRPTPDQMAVDVEMGGFGWSNEQGLHIPMEQDSLVVLDAPYLVEGIL
ncbi:DUF7397 family protein [Streptomyces sp. CoH17]|uniref:DUF7397 family protein n=1 Tax=Streptomyces sp. CoH17 TaxID=2992806 RepID=UPI003B636DD4